MAGCRCLMAKPCSVGRPSRMQIGMLSKARFASSSGTSGLLRTTTQFDDFELILDFKSDEKTNSGIFLRTSPEPQNPLTDCYELNIAIACRSSFPTGSLVGRAATKLDFPNRHLAAGTGTRRWSPSFKSGSTKNKTLDYVDPKPLGRGYLGLQFNSGAVAFRNIRLRPLNMFEVELGRRVDKLEP